MHSVQEDNMSDFSDSFTIHTTLTPLPSTAYDNYMRDGALANYRDGMNARVHAFRFEDQSDDVFKVTCCEPTTQLFMWAYEAMASGRLPPGLPSVKACHGLCALDADGFQFEGFTVERLRPAETEHERGALRALLVAARGCRQRLEDRLPSSCSWQVSHRVARWLSLQNVGGLREAFRVVAAVIKTTRSTLDIEQAGNVLFTQDGRLCLADPVAMSFSAP
jgi:hypothetical protein